MNTDLHVIILAAGKGQRMMSDLPKVLHCIGGKPMLERVIDTARLLQPKSIHIVHGNGGGTVSQALAHLPVNWVKQSEQLGTGHAVSQALPHCPDDGRVLVLYGDVPLISIESLRGLLDATPVQGIGLIVAEFPNPDGFGRIIRDSQNRITAIVEHRDATESQRAIKEINTGIITAPAQALKNWLPKLKNLNQQHEYYLTDIIALARTEGMEIHGARAVSDEETRGVNDRVELAALERFYQQRLAKSLMRGGVTIADPARLDLRGDITIATDVFLDINVILEGRVVIGKNSRIGAQVILKDVEIGENVEILANSVIEGAIIAHQCVVGPFARLRPGTVLETGVKVGNFVEVKKSRLGAGSKANHLSYLGDALIGSHVNIGAGAITCNYDGQNKHQTRIEDGVFIGSNTSLVAPLVIEQNATIGAGSTITRDAPADVLTVGRARQTTIKSWRRPKTRTE